MSTHKRSWPVLTLLIPLFSFPRVSQVVTLVEESANTRTHLCVSKGYNIGQSYQRFRDDNTLFRLLYHSLMFLHLVRPHDSVRSDRTLKSTFLSDSGTDQGYLVVDGRRSMRNHVKCNEKDRKRDEGNSQISTDDNYKHYKIRIEW